ncbi:hypothetical protein [Latilactobacillus fragifolii]|uniref:hypothetical protein n=1 Tax=Latilactobacillus fragifolii TaxID=2814244 RepID=UPI001ABACCD2|nr:hypothetical protein [Latilactobacillus fragifolii]
MQNERLKNGDILNNVMDIFGNVHRQVSIIRVMENTVTGEDRDTHVRRVFHKQDIGMTPRGKYGYDSDASKKSFDLEESHQLKWGESELLGKGASQIANTSRS